MRSGFPRLLSPLSLGKRTLKNRIALTAHGDRFAKNGLVTEGLISHYERRAAGEVGLIVALGSAPIHAGASGSNPYLVSLWDDNNEPLLTAMAARIHAHGALLLGQATHRGPRERPTGPDAVVLAPSAVPGAPPTGSPAVLRTAEIRQLVQAYAQAARRLERCGFDGIQITALGSHLIEQFWSPVLNCRTDSYGGDPQNRMRFGLEVLEAVAEAVSEDFLISFRMSGDLMTDAVGLAPEDLLGIAQKLDDLGRIDLFDISGGSGFSTATHTGVVPTDDFPTSCYNHLARTVRERVSAPVLVAGRILNPEAAEKALTEGACDVVGMTRALIADPLLPFRVRSGAVERIRPCIAINEGCRRVLGANVLACTVNPEVGDSVYTEPPLPATPRRILVVGGGPAGLEAARVAAERTHNVILIEQAKGLGGQVNLAALSPLRPHLGLHVNWLTNEVHRLGVEVMLDTVATQELVADLQPEALIIGTGSASYLPIELADLSCPAATDVALLDGDIRIRSGSRVVVYDVEGYHRGGNIAAFAAEAGAHVDLVTPFSVAAENIEGPLKRGMHRQLEAHKVSIWPRQRLVGANGRRLLLQDVWTDSSTIAPEADMVVVVGYYRSNARLYDELLTQESDIEIHLVGDARAPRLLRNAISEGARAGISL